MPVARQIGLLWGAVAVSIVLLAPYGLRLADAPWPCPFKAIVGLPCLTCGGTRATVALGHGALLGALGLNPLVTLGWLALVGGGVIAGVGAATRRPLPPLPRLSGAGRAGLGLALIADWSYLVWAGI